MVPAVPAEPVAPVVPPVPADPVVPPEPVVPATPLPDAPAPPLVPALPGSPPVSDVAQAAHVVTKAHNNSDLTAGRESGLIKRLSLRVHVAERKGTDASVRVHRRRRQLNALSVRAGKGGPDWLPPNCLGASCNSRGHS